MKSFPAYPRVLPALLVLFYPSAADATVCDVPSPSHATIRAAVANPTCTEIDVAPGTFAERVYVRRNLTISGDSSPTTTIEGRVVATGAGVALVLNDLKVEAGTPLVAGCFPEAATMNGGGDSRRQQHGGGQLECQRGVSVHRRLRVGRQQRVVISRAVNPNPSP
jgi:hypothetical protein